MPILLHGDAAFAGQGIVAETFNLYALEGYSTGGTLHLITNNQVGFTTDPAQGRSTRHSSDLAKGFDTPIIHVNADDPEAAISAVRLALAYRGALRPRRRDRPRRLPALRPQRAGRARVHPAADGRARSTSHPTVRELYGARLVEQGVLTAGGGRRARRRRRRPRSARRTTGCGRRSARSIPAKSHDEPVPREGQRPSSRRASARSACAGSPSSCCASPRASPSTRSSRASSSAAVAALDEGGIDWGHAESLAFASLLREGVPIRLTGQDTERGTFSHRHLVLPRRAHRRDRDPDAAARRRRRRRSRSTTRRSPSTPASASSTATRPRRPRRSSSGRRSSATSRTARRRSSTSSSRAGSRSGSRPRA